MGMRIGQGSFRSAHMYRDDPSYVVKCSIARLPSDNLVEWLVWRTLRKSALVNVFGRIVAISESGRLLIMERLDSISPGDYAQTPSVPDWVGDVRPDSFGKDIGGAIKLRDFGRLNFETSTLIRKRWQRD